MSNRTVLNRQDSINKEITLIKDEEITRSVISLFIENYWFAPQDCLLRSIETLIWAKRTFIKPILDIGTGDGKMSRFMLSMNQKVDVGIDIDSKAVSNAIKNKNFGIYDKIFVEDASKMSFPNSSFNTILSNSTFEHIQKDLEAIKEVSRVLKKDGYFYVTLPLPSHQKFLKRLGVGKEELHKYNERVVHYHYRSFNEWIDLLKKNNLKVIYSKSYIPLRVEKIWYIFHKIATFKPYRRELWSYLKDSPYGKLFPSFIVKPFLKKIILFGVKKAFNGDGAWLFLVARKV